MAENVLLLLLLYLKLTNVVQKNTNVVQVTSNKIAAISIDTR